MLNPKTNLNEYSKKKKILPDVKKENLYYLQAKRRTGGGSLSLEGIYRSLNRTCLYMLSRPTNSNVAGQMSVLEVLHKIVDHRNIIFGAGNHELDFFGSLTFCLLRLSAAKNIPLEPEGKN